MRRLTKSSSVVSLSQIEKALAKVQLLDRKIGVKEMEHGVERADVFICCLTDDYIRSHRCNQELAFARKHGAKWLLHFRNFEVNMN